MNSKFLPSILCALIALGAYVVLAQPPIFPPPVFPPPPPTCGIVPCQNSCDRANRPLFAHNQRLRCTAVFINECLVRCPQRECNRGFFPLNGGTRICGRICQRDSNGCYH